MTNGKDDEPTKVSRVRELRPSTPASTPAQQNPAGAETKIIRSGTPTPPPAPPGNRPAGGGPAAADRGASVPDPGRTIVRPPPRPQPPQDTAEPNVPASNPAPHPPRAGAGQDYDPVVGWLVVVAGPGRGASLPVYEGMNSVGRDAGQRIPINFGDGQISREGAFFVTYEPKRRNFYVNHGGRTNLVYRNDDPVLGPELLNKGDKILVGATTLMFVPLCGADFTWDSMA